ncbi:hypothetical protein SAMN05444921_113200 [Streptomyces wuyuanensis]|uniref:Uncharacterized protein n=2 Tax=Streptomyces wuyuanensis TaxID=1196353 RepID=A0A1G9W8F9_9ACTN|nr:hypothetical protein SAMN05444921_113200 [Streptomyces wuyuanensis]
MQEERRAVAEMDRLRDAEAAVAELRGALARAGVTLPSLGVDPLSYTGDEQGVLVELGRCSVDTARLMAAALPAEETGR